MRYDLMVHEAMRGVVRAALLRAAESDGLPGGHHFYVEFSTKAPGVEIAERLLDEYPEAMTIVFKTQYWDLHVGHESFSVGMSFNRIPEHLSIPFSAVTRFYDPTVSFGLHFEANKGEDAPKMESVVRSVPDADDERDESSDAEVVSLDAFRKK